MHNMIHSWEHIVNTQINTLNNYYITVGRASMSREKNVYAWHRIQSEIVRIRSIEPPEPFDEWNNMKNPFQTCKHTHTHTNFGRVNNRTYAVFPLNATIHVAAMTMMSCRYSAFNSLTRTHRVSPHRLNACHERPHQSVMICRFRWFDN